MDIIYVAVKHPWVYKFSYLYFVALHSTVILEISELLT